MSCTDQPSASFGQMTIERDLEQVAQTAELVPNGFRRRVERLLQIARYYRKDQLLRRAWRKITGENSWRGAREESWFGRLTLTDAGRVELAKIARLRQVRMIEELQAFHVNLKRGTFTLLGEQRALGDPIDWEANISPRPGRLWRFHLHYHEYLLDLAAGSGWHCEATWATIWDIIESWIAQNPRVGVRRHSDAWHPYCISRRLAVWLQLAAMALPPGDRGQRVLASCAEQAEFLSKNLERDLGGNHLLENAHALILAGSALAIDVNRSDGQQNVAWLRKAEVDLRRELPRQLLAHGEHFERSPMYHSQVLGNLLQMGIISSHAAPQLSQYCLEAASAMEKFLSKILHPDGEIPYLADSCFGESYSVAELKTLAELAGMTSAIGEEQQSSVCGPYWVWRNGEDMWIFDAGPMAADCLPAHSHCDLLGFEASLGGKRWFIDSGSFRYDDAAMRRYCRSSIAHNVVTVDDLNQSDIWSAFRMGYRGWPTSFVAGSDGPFDWVAASHNAYRRVGVTTTERLLVATRKGAWACFDHLRAQAPKTATGRLHLAPAVRVEQLDEYRFVLQQGETRRILTFLETGRVNLAVGWHCPTFGRRERTAVFEYTVADRRCVVLGWLLSPFEELSATIVQEEPVAMVVVRDEANGTDFKWRFGSECPVPAVK